jgi:5-methylcytosine-specific restriction endonuclease McrA
MGKWRHRLSSINTIEMTADCDFCGKRIKIVFSDSRPRCKKAKFMQGRPRWHYREQFFNRKIIGVCVKCGVKDKDKRFFDVNHKDGNHKNNNFDNLELLCPNCHRKETLRQTDEKFK